MCSTSLELRKFKFLSYSCDAGRKLSGKIVYEKFTPQVQDIGGSFQINSLVLCAKNTRKGSKDGYIEKKVWEENCLNPGRIRQSEG